MSAPTPTPSLAPIHESGVLEISAARMVNRHAHDVRNHLNFLDLSMQILTEEVTTEDGETLLGKMQQELAQVEATLRSLLLRFNPPEPSPVSTLDLVQMWKTQTPASADSGKLIDWLSNDASAVVRLDAKVIAAVLREITQMAWKRVDGQSLQATVRISDGTQVILEILEPAQTQAMPADLLAEWTQAVQANGGALEHDKCPENASWSTRLVFPLLR